MTNKDGFAAFTASACLHHLDWFSCFSRLWSKLVEVSFERQTDLLVFTIRDQGQGFDWSRFLDFDPERVFDPNGRGIAMARSISFDSLEYQGNGNIVVVTVKLTNQNHNNRCLLCDVRLSANNHGILRLQNGNWSLSIAICLHKYANSLNKHRNTLHPIAKRRQRVLYFALGNAKCGR
jgi:hypothetical protein